MESMESPPYCDYFNITTSPSKLFFFKPVWFCGVSALRGHVPRYPAGRQALVILRTAPSCNYTQIRQDLSRGGNTLATAGAANNAAARAADIAFARSLVLARKRVLKTL